MATGPRAVFEQIVSTGYPWIQQAIGKELESVFLEFKEKETPDREDLQSSDRKNYAKELSAFANASGGVIVWGISSDNTISDLAGAEKPIKFPKSLCAKLNNLSATALDPPLAGLENCAITIPGKEDEGSWLLTSRKAKVDLIEHSAGRTSTLSEPARQVLTWAMLSWLSTLDANAARICG